MRDPFEEAFESLPYSHALSELHILWSSGSWGGQKVLIPLLMLAWKDSCMSSPFSCVGGTSIQRLLRVFLSINQAWPTKSTSSVSLIGWGQPALICWTYIGDCNIHPAPPSMHSPFSCITDRQFLNQFFPGIVSSSKKATYLVWASNPRANLPWYLKFLDESTTTSTDVSTGQLQSFLHNHISFGVTVWDLIAFTCSSRYSGRSWLGNVCRCRGWFV